MKKSTKKAIKALEAKNPKDVIIVGIGASAGGLEALQEFFKAMPVDSGLAFVVVQHLSPDYRSLMAELLARQTNIPIRIATDGCEVKENTIYLLPPRKNISVFHGKLYLEEQNLKKGLNMPVDIFFRSLALDKGKQAIGIILSGTGSDGMLGSKAIKEAGGMIMVQSEDSAKFDGMPRSAISTGLVDYILPPSKMPEALINYVKHPFTSAEKTLEKNISENLDTLTKIILILRNYSGIDFSYYKENTIIRRLERRVSINRFHTLDEYYYFLSESDKEKEILFREMLIGVTRFFREAQAFQALKDKVLPYLLTPNKKLVRIWVPGCSTGEEVYSIAILVKEYMDTHNIDTEVKIFATDIDKYALEQAGTGFFPDSIVSDVDSFLLTKYFKRYENGYLIHEAIRKMIVFASHNLLKDPPFSKLDLISCRNLFIYFKPEIQTRILNSFYLSLNPHGYLFLGSSESIGELTEAFITVDNKWKIYKQKYGYKPTMEIHRNIARDKINFFETEIPTPVVAKTMDNIRLEKLMNKVVSELLPPSVIIDSNDNIVQIINDVEPFVKLLPGKFSQNLFNNMPQELSLFVSTQLRKLKKEGKPLIMENLIGIKGFEKYKITIETREFNVANSTYYMLTFRKEEINNVDSTENFKVSSIDDVYAARIAELEKELQYTRESLQATVEELETSNEELQSSNEELIASNEELQSTNEELQSVNEELHTVNSEYQLKIEELTRLNNDITNLLRNIEVGALYLDSNLCIRKITPLVTKITNILQTDIGRPINHISMINSYDGLYDDILHVVETLQPIDREFKYKQTSYYVKIRPYRTEFNAVDGIIITFIDVTKLKNEEEKTQKLLTQLKNAFEIGNMGYWEYDFVEKKYTISPELMKILNINSVIVEQISEETVNNLTKYIHPADFKRIENEYNETIKSKKEIFETEFRVFPENSKDYICLSQRCFITYGKDGQPLKVNAIVQDITRFKKLQQEIQKQKELFERMLEFAPEAKVYVDADGNIVFANKKALELFGITREEVINRTYDSKKWEIRDLNNKPIPSDKLPFAIIKTTKQPISNYQHYIKVGRKKTLLTISGVPMFDSQGNFDGALFTIETK